jgi:rhodanese-related sulfurtransferase
VESFNSWRKNMLDKLSIDRLNGKPMTNEKTALFEAIAQMGKAFASPVRLELLDLLAQGEKTVEALAEQSSAGIKNASAHLRVLRQARLVQTRRDGTHIYYRLADSDVSRFVRDLQHLGRRQLAEVEQVARQFIDERDELEPVTLAELRKLLRDGDVTVIDVRPRDEYEAGHIPGAVSVPVVELKRRLRELPKRREVIAYCRGPYCVFSLEAVTELRKHGFRARRSEDGLPAWRDAGLPVTVGAPND